MLRRQVFRYRIYPTPEQEARLLAWEHSLRWLWNLALEQRRMCLSRPRDERVFLTAFDQMKELTGLRADLPWLADVPRNVCGQLLANLDRAWKRCFARVFRAPRFKAKDRCVLGLCEPHPRVWRLDGSVLRFPKLGGIRAVVHRTPVGKPKTCTIKRDGDQWLASIVCEIDVPDPAPRIDPTVAIDRGVANAVADSDGTIIRSPQFFARAMKRLARAQRVVSRRKKGSKNREKAKNRVMRLHRKVRRQREHFVHELSARYAKSHGTVIVETLNIRNMTKSASGTKEAAGRNVRQKSGLNRAILDVGWGRFVDSLRYKLEWSGGRLIEVPAAYSSQTCSACGHVDPKSRRSQAEFSCVACGFEGHADVNAALVLKSRANRPALPVEGDSARRSRKRVGAVRCATE